MKNTFTKLFFVLAIAGTFSSCLEARRATTCPSHDPNYFREYPYTKLRKRRLLAENKIVIERRVIQSVSPVIYT